MWRSKKYGKYIGKCIERTLKKIFRCVSWCRLGGGMVIRGYVEGIGSRSPLDAKVQGFFSPWRKDGEPFISAVPPQQIWRAGWLCIYWKKYLSISGPVQFTPVVFRISCSCYVSRGHHRAMSKPRIITQHHSLEKQSLCTHPELALPGQDEDNTSSQWI